MAYPDMTATLQAALDDAAGSRLPFTIPPGGHRLAATGLGYASNARIVVGGDLYNDHGPRVGTLYCLTNRSGKRLNNVTIVGAGGAFVGAASDPAGATRKGLGIVDTDGFTVIGVRTEGPLTGFAMEIKNAAGGHINGLTLNSGVPGRAPTAFISSARAARSRDRTSPCRAATTPCHSPPKTRSRSMR
ncbi:hypothetical protein P0F65_10060 [Sphingomonas sp. I4]